MFPWLSTYKIKISKSALQSESGRDVLDASSIDKKVIFIVKLPSTYQGQKKGKKSHQKGIEPQNPDLIADSNVFEGGVKIWEFFNQLRRRSTLRGRKRVTLVRATLARR